MKLRTRVVGMTAAGLVGAGVGLHIADEAGYMQSPDQKAAYAKALEEEMDHRILDSQVFGIGRFTVGSMDNSHLGHLDVELAQKEMVRRAGYELDKNEKIDMIAACAMTLVSMPQLETGKPSAIPAMVFNNYQAGIHMPESEQLCMDATIGAIESGLLTEIPYPKELSGAPSSADQA
jgi:hypothetical protein